MIDFKPTLASYARVSYFRELHGDLDGSAATRCGGSGVGRPGPGERRSYVQTLLGNLEFERGRLSAAETSYRDALTGFAGYAPAEAGLARIRGGPRAL